MAGSGPHATLIFRVGSVGTYFFVRFALLKSRLMGGAKPEGGFGWLSGG